MIYRFAFALAATLTTLLLGCQAPDDAAPPPALEAGEGDPAEAFAGPIERAHSLRAWKQKEAFRSEIVVRFGDATLVDGRLLMTPDMARIRLDLDSGAAAIWDGSDAWVSPPDAEFPMARFHVLTWPYFLSAPMKLRDPGTRLEILGEKPLEGVAHPAARLTFDSGIGDTPDDWYVLYRDPESDRLAAMAYIVTFGTTTEEAEKEPHAITYGDLVDVEGVAVPTRWTFWLWSEEEGAHGEPLGSVTLTDPAFVSLQPDDFEVPEGARPEKLPVAGTAE